MIKIKMWLIAVGAAVAGIFAVYLTGRRDARDHIISQQSKRLRDAIEADTRARERIARGELLNDDGHKRPD